MVRKESNKSFSAITYKSKKINLWELLWWVMRNWKGLATSSCWNPFSRKKTTTNKKPEDRDRSGSTMWTGLSLTWPQSSGQLMIGCDGGGPLQLRYLFPPNRPPSQDPTAGTFYSWSSHSLSLWCCRRFTRGARPFRRKLHMQWCVYICRRHTEALLRCSQCFYIACKCNGCRF